MRSAFHNGGGQEHLPGGGFPTHNQNFVIGARNHASSHNHQGDHPESGPVIQVPPRVPSRTQSDTHSRPESRRSNYGKSMTRPFSSHGLYSPGASEFAVLHSNHATKINKSSRGQNHVLPNAQSNSPARTDTRQPEERSGLLQSFHDYLKTVSMYDDMIRNFEQQKQQIEFQKNEIANLRNSDNSSQKLIKALEKEKEDLTQRLNKLEELSSKYKKHMNEVVNTQKWLKTEAEKIKKTSSQALARYALYVENGGKEAATEKLRSAIEDSKELRVAVEKSASGKYYGFLLL
jgi:hypothetical protein